ncbi:MAG: fasciclin domain-containing protein [Bacteroidota bacterium]
MKTLWNHFLNLRHPLVLALSLLVVLTACEEEENNPVTPEPEPNALQLAQDNDDLSSLVDAVNRTDLADALSDEENPVTIFAPNNSAFAQFLEDNPDFSSLDDIPEDVLTDVLSYHVVAGKTLSSELTAGDIPTLLSGQSLSITLDNGVTLNGNIQVVSADNEVSNGVVHIINGVLSPMAREEADQSIVEIVTEGEDFSILETALTKFPDIVETLQGDGPFTVFGPNNDAFVKFLEEDDRFAALEDIPDDVLKSVLQYHVLAGGKTAADLGASEETVQGESIAITKTEDGVTINGDIAVTTPDVMATNGVIHVIDNVLLPPSLRTEPTIAEIAVATEDLSILVAALGRAPDLLAAAGDPNAALTVFAPTNAAFEQLLADSEDFNSLDDIPDDVLTTILQYHILASIKTAANLEETEETLNGETISVMATGDGVTLNEDVNVTTPNIPASNGVVHLIDKVLMPPSLQPQPTIAELAVGTDDLSILVAALGRAPDLLAAAGDPEAMLTVFAPTNAAFEKLLEDSEDFNSLDDIPDDVLTSILQYHILGSIKKAADLMESEETLNGESIMVMATDEGVTLNGEVKVETPDVVASNGVVHLIDMVLMPPSLQPQPTIAELAAGNENLSILVAALGRAPDLLAAAGNPEAMLTVFAPTNEAFAMLLEEDPRFNSLDDIPDDVLTEILQYHILGATKLAADLMEMEETLSGDNLSIDKSDGVVINGDVTVTDGDIMAANGVVHVIDKVLVPEALAPPKTIAEIAVGTEDLSILVAALQRTPDLLEVAADFNADITVFAPTNDAFVDLLATLSDVLGVQLNGLEDVPDYVLRRVLEYHILNAGKLADDLMNQEETLEGSNLDIEKNGGVVINGNTNVIGDLANIEAANGVVHVIDAVLIPPFIGNALGTALQSLVFDAEGRFTTLLAAVESQEAVLNFLTRQDNVDGTLFAPTNAAFEALINENNGLNSLEDVLALDNLSDILLFHVGADRKERSDLTAASSATHSRLLNPNTGSPLEIYYSNVDGTLILIGYSEVVDADIETPNEEFIIHAINAVLIPPTASVVGVAVDNPQFSQLVAALTRVEEASGDDQNLLPLVTILSGERGEQDLAPFTVFAPTNAAFEALLEALGVGSVDEVPIETLQAVLLYHVISGEPVFSTDLSNGEAETIGGTITIDADNLTIADGNEDNTDASIVGTNILATNGVIHVIDQVLLPE